MAVPSLRLWPLLHNQLQIRVPMKPFLVSMNFLEKLKVLRKTLYPYIPTAITKDTDDQLDERYLGWGMGEKVWSFYALSDTSHTKHLQVYSYAHALWTSPFGFLRRFCYLGMTGHLWSTQHSALLPSLEVGRWGWKSQHSSLAPIFLLANTNLDVN